MKILATLLLAAGLGTLAIGSSSAMPVNNLATAAPSDVEQARIVCNWRGRCWRTYPRYGYGYYRPSYGYAPYYRPYRPGITFRF